jgi:pimeloyl-ACP methyl ester carboxylesterase
MMKRFCFVVAFLLASAFVTNASASPDSLLIDVRGVSGTPSFQSPTGIWWPKAVERASAKGKKPRTVKHAVRTARESAGQSSVIVWFHGGMGSSNCAKGLVAGASFADLYPKNIVVSVSACRENHWVTKGMIDAVDAALDSVASRRKSPVEKVSLVGVSDGSLGVLAYSLEGRRAVDDRLLMSSYGGFLGEPQAIASQKKMQTGRWRFLQGGKDRLYPSDQTVPWITEFCKAVQVDCELRFDPEGEHDWLYWNDKRMDWIHEAVKMEKTP